jgi:hypothetical protein
VKEQQEVLGHIADVVIEVYAIESALARTEKLLAGRDESKGRLAADMVRVYVTDSADKLFRSSRQVARACASGGAAGVLGEHLSALSTYAGVDTIAARRRVADAVVAAGKQPF